MTTPREAAERTVPEDSGAPRERSTYADSTCRVRVAWSPRSLAQAPAAGRTPADVRSISRASPGSGVTMGEPHQAQSTAYQSLTITLAGRHHTRQWPWQCRHLTTVATWRDPSRYPLDTISARLTAFVKSGRAYGRPTIGRRRGASVVNSETALTMGLDWCPAPRAQGFRARPMLPRLSNRHGGRRR
jgi:hypothetical protein